MESRRYVEPSFAIDTWLYPPDTPKLTLMCWLAVTKQDIEEHFSTHGSGKITEIKLMNGFGFIEYEDAMDARDVVPGKSGL